MAYEYRILLGKIARVSGYEGFVTVRLEKEFIENIPGMESVFIVIEGRPVPFFISHKEYSGGDNIRLRFESYDTYDKISEFSGCRVFLTTAGKDKTATESPGTVVGFRVILRDRKVIGTIEEIIQNPGQELLRILSPQKREILIPFHEDFILRFDPGRKTIMVDIPEGLTEIN